MAKQGDWGGGGRSNIPDSVDRDQYVTKKATVTVSGPSFVVEEYAPKLRYNPWPSYDREPLDPEFRTNEAKGTPDIQADR